MNKIKILMILLLGSVAAFSQPRPNKPVHNYKPPVTTNRAPVVVNRPPVVTNRGPVVVHRSPIVVQRPPIYVNRGPVIIHRPDVVVRPPVYIPYHGVSYRYSNGYFYRPYGSYWRPGFPPIGIRVGFLPFGYSPLYVGSSLYYYNSGSFYRRYDNNNYEVVDPPMGAVLKELPRGAERVTVNGEDFYELNGTYYKEGIDSKGRTIYTVTGKDGDINNTENVAPEINNSLQPGDIVDNLPQDCKTITLNGETYYISPDDVYFRETIDSSNKTSYEVVGKPTDNVGGTQQ